MAKPPPTGELSFLGSFTNFRELTSKLNSLSVPAPDIYEYASHVCACWFRLAEQHLEEAKKALASGISRSAYSRAYYAAYNASKSARYFTSGFVSLKGDDHKRAGPDLPDDLPDVARWSQDIGKLYEHRLRSDYDNWSNTQAAHTMTEAQVVQAADEFLAVVRSYMSTKHGVIL